MRDIKVITETIIDVLIKNGIELSDDEKQGIIKAFSTRGSYAGYLKKSLPKRGNTLARGAWLGLQPNIYKISVGAVLISASALDDANMALHDKLVKYNMPYWLDKDMRNLKEMGVW